MAFLKINKWKLWIDIFYAKIFAILINQFILQLAFFIKNIWSKSSQNKNYKGTKKLWDIERNNLHLEITELFSVSMTPWLWKLNENRFLSIKHPYWEVFFFVVHHSVLNSLYSMVVFIRTINTSFLSSLTTYNNT